MPFTSAIENPSLTHNTNSLNNFLSSRTAVILLLLLTALALSPMLRIGFINDDISALIAVNITALTRLSAVAAKAFAARGKGAIVNLSSAMAFLDIPEAADYAEPAGHAHRAAQEQPHHGGHLGRPSPSNVGVQSVSHKPDVFRVDAKPRGGRFEEQSVGLANRVLRRDHDERKTLGEPVLGQLVANDMLTE